MAVKQLYPNQRPTLNLNFARSKVLDPRITFTRNSTATYVGSNGLIQTAAAGEARFDHDGNGDCQGLLIEESRINSHQNSVFTQTSDWLTSNPANHGTVTANNATAPDGTNTAAALVAGNQTDRVFSMPANSTNDQFIFSIFVKRGTGDNLQLGSLAWTTQGSIDYTFSTDSWGTNYNLADYGKEDYGNGWVRLWIRYGAAGNGTTYVRWGDSSPSGTTGWFWGAQQELGNLPTSYIPTSGSTVTRNADDASITGTNFSSWYNQSEGSWYVEAKCPVSSNNQWIFALNPSGTGEDMLYRGSTDALRSLARYRGDVFDTNDAPSGQFNKAILGYELTAQASSYFNTVSGIYSSISGNTGTPTSLAFGLTPGNSVLNGHISRLTYYPTRLTDSQLQELTS